MKHQTREQASGFTLLELMIVILIIGIFSAIAIPGIIEIRYRDTLTASVERVKSSVQTTRDFAMKTRNAAVLEVRAQTMWINLLDGPRCTDAIAIRCAGAIANTAGEVPVYEAGGLGQAAGIALMGGKVLKLAAPEGETDETCSDVDTLTVSGDAGFALCYNGSGELRYRLGGDDTSTCSPDATATPSGADWQYSCSVDPVTGIADTALPDGEKVSLTDGAVLGLNRYENGAIDQEKVDVLRLVYVPINGAPYSLTTTP